MTQHDIIDAILDDVMYDAVTFLSVAYFILNPLVFCHISNNTQEVASLVSKCLLSLSKYLLSKQMFAISKQIFAIPIAIPYRIAIFLLSRLLSPIG